MYKLGLLFLLAAVSPVVFAHGVSVEDQALLLNANWLDYMKLGATHMLTGYDHILFLFAVIFFLTKFNEIIKFITAFTIGHSITLVFATLFSIQANYYLIDAVIALTICYKAFDNLDGFNKYFSLRAPNLIWTVFIIGLIHGFGLSTRLQQLPLSENGLVFKILSFNVGIELGQIIVLSLMLVVLSGWRKTNSFQVFSKAANVVLIFAGLLLFIMQLHSFQHAKYAEEFPLNIDAHYHAHEAMNSADPEVLDLNDTVNDEILEPDVHTHDGINFHSH